MGGRAIDEALQRPWQRKLQFGTVIFTAFLCWTMYSIAPRYQRETGAILQQRIAEAVANGSPQSVLDTIREAKIPQNEPRK